MKRICMLAALIFFATFTVPAPVIAQTNPAQGVADETQSTEFLQTLKTHPALRPIESSLP